MTRPPALVLRAPGTNRDHDVAHALHLAGAEPRIALVDEAAEQPSLLQQARLLVVAGGFSHGDALGAGRLLALDLQERLADGLRAFVAAGRPVLGICNGFQALVRAGILPGAIAGSPPGVPASVALGHNERGRFECRWVTLAPQGGRCVWTAPLVEPVQCPVAHGEGRFVAQASTLAALRDAGQVALVYADAHGAPADGAYPANPNGSSGDVAGICDATGLVLGLMPHPEDHVTPLQHARRSRGEQTGSGLPLFQAGVRCTR